MGEPRHEGGAKCKLEEIEMSNWSSGREDQEKVFATETRDELLLTIARMRTDFAVLAATVTASVHREVDPEASQIQERSNMSSMEHLPLGSEDGDDFAAPARPLRWYQRCWRRRPGKKIPKWVVNNVLLFSFLWQCLVVILYRLAFDPGAGNQDASAAWFRDVGVAVMIVMQLVQLIFIVIISVKLSKQVLHHTVTNWFLVQTYLATILLYAGVYTVIERAAPRSFRGVFNEADPLPHAVVTVRFLYFSCQTMTTTGYGDIVSQAWYCDFVVITQMLLSVLYTTVIFSKGLAFFSLEPPVPRKKKNNNNRYRPLGSAATEPNLREIS